MDSCAAGGRRPSFCALADFAALLRAQARASRQRRLVVLAGGREWGRRAARALLGGAGLDEPLWITDLPPEGAVAGVVPPARRGRLLGSEAPLVVLDLWAGLDADALGVAAGIVPGGGILLLLTPPLESWEGWQDPLRRSLAPHPLPPERVAGRFAGRLARLLQGGAEGVAVIREGVAQLPTLSPATAPSSLPSRGREGRAVTVDQQRAVEAVLRAARGQRRRPALLIADRGRGKSAALGIAAAELLGEGEGPLVVTAPHREGVEALFRQAGRGEASALRFLPPDQVCRTLPECRLLLVDEAAAIHPSLLEQMLEHYPRVALATTVHGYEGSGRGFELRFGELLERHTRGVRRVELAEPIRWATGDPVERFLDRALLLDAEPAPVGEVAAASLETVREISVDRDLLARNEPLLRQLFGLLVAAHYRTRPSDLRFLLDAAGLHLRLLMEGEWVVAVALVVEEGGLAPEVAEEIVAGVRRPQGHLLAETLASHLGMREGATLRSHRVVRIAVHPALRRRRLGRLLLGRVVETAREAGVDFVGASFGVSAPLLSFWLGAGFRPARLSIRRGASSGEHSLVMIYGLGNAGRILEEKAVERFRRHFPCQLGDPMREMDPLLAGRLLAACGGTHAMPPAEIIGELHRFAHQRVIPEEVMPALHWLAIHAPALQDFPPDDAALLVARQLQHRAWSGCARHAGLSGRREVVARLREIVRLAIEMGVAGTHLHR